MIATIRGSVLGGLAERGAEDVGPVGALLDGEPAVGVEGRHPVELVNFVCNRRAVALALVGHDVHDNRSPDVGRVTQRLLDRLEVVTVDRAAVLEPEGLEHRDRRDELLQRVLHAPRGLVGGVPDRGERAERGSRRVLGGLVTWRQTKVAEVLRHPADGRRIAAPVVVEDDHHLRLQLPDVVEGFVGHPAGERTVADDADHLAGLAAELASGGEAERVAQPGRRVRVLHEVVLRLAPRGVSAQSALLAQRLELEHPAREHLVDIGLVPGVEDDRVLRAVEHAVHRNRELDDAEVGAEVPARPGDRADEHLSDLSAEAGEVFGSEPAQVLGSGDLLEQHKGQSSGGARFKADARKRAHPCGGA